MMFDLKNLQDRIRGLKKKEEVGLERL